MQMPEAPETNEAQDDMSESEKLRFEAEVKLALEEKKQQGAIELELLKQRADMAKSNVDPSVIYDDNFTRTSNPVVDSIAALTDHIANLGATLNAPRRLVRDETGKAIGSVIDTGEQ